MDRTFNCLNQKKSVHNGTKRKKMVFFCSRWDGSFNGGALIQEIIGLK